MNPLNKGKQAVAATAGLPNSISYGNQSPFDDAVPLAWRLGDVRYWQDTDGQNRNNIKWVCIAAGAPGIWQLVRTPYLLPVLQIPLFHNGDYNNFGQAVLMAPATADWVFFVEGALPALWPIPSTPDIESAAPGPCVVELSLWITKNVWDVTTPGGMVFSVNRVNPDNSEDVLGTGAVNADPAALGRFIPVSVALNAGDIDTGQGLYASVTVDLLAGAGDLNLGGVLTLYRDFTADFPS